MPLIRHSKLQVMNGQCLIHSDMLRILIANLTTIEYDDIEASLFIYLNIRVPFNFRKLKYPLQSKMFVLFEARMNAVENF